MAKTYEIWRKNADPDRYDIDNYSFILDVTPMGEPELITSRYKDEVFYRTEISDITFSGSDFYKLLCIREDDLQNQLVMLFVVIDGKTPTYDGDIYWKGFISVFNGEWDEDECNVVMKPTVFDEYTSILETSSVSVNLIVNISPRKTFYGETNAWAEWKITDCITPAVPDPELVNSWTFVAWTPFINLGMNAYARKRASCLINDTFEVVVESGVTKFVGEYTVVDPASILTIGTCASPPSPIANYYEIYDGSGTGSCADSCVWILKSAIDSLTQLPLEVTQDYTDSIHIDDIIDEFISPHGLTYVSQFFNDADNPITGSANKLGDLLFLQGSNAGDPTATEKASVMDMTFNEFTFILRDLNARWYIDIETYPLIPKFRIEHIKFFENNLSYSDAKIVGIDATQKVDVRTGALSIAKSNKYERQQNKLYKYEEFLWSSSETRNFVGTKIYYDHESVNVKIEDNTKPYQSLVLTDFPLVLSKPDLVPNTSIFVVAGEVDGGVYKIPSEASAFDKYITAIQFYEDPNRLNNLPNNHLSWGNLHEAYYTYNRILEDGFLNNVLQTFDSVIQTIKQQEISFALCPDEFNPLELIKTGLSDDGYVVSGVENMRTGTLTVVLEYAKVDNARTCACLVVVPIEIGTWIVGVDCQEIS